VLFGSGLLHAQGLFSPLFSEVHTIPSDSGLAVYYSYRIPFSNLVFEKAGNIYSADFRILAEVTDSTKNFITRQINEKNIAAKDFEQTNSKEIFYEGLVSFNIPRGTYFLNPIFTDINSGRETKLEPVYIPSSNKKNFLKAIIANSGEFNCDEKSFRALANFNENVPFDENEKEFIIPSADTSVSNIFAMIVNNTDTIFNGKVEEQMISPLNFFECGGKVLISRKNPGKPIKLFILKNKSKDLFEGILTIFVSENPINKGLKAERVYNGKVYWYNKPFSLINAELAIKMLKYVEGDSVINKMLSSKEEDYPKQLFNYWKKYDPAPETAFNPLMLEYYNRVDYAQRNFSTITGTKGIDSDRGMVFIKFGKPTKVERTSDGYGKIVETWLYEKLQRRFVFVDRRGTGEFLLRNG
jgi:GWxTD domain-containing protein